MSLSLLNGKDAESTVTLVAADSSSALQVVTSTVWQTVTSAAFAVGTCVGAVLMYTGIRLAQHYLEAQDPDADRPF
ncbi:MAG: hypothetical protein HYZ50_08540 [Deltaproteobacteria bacterium]|nr:hypothetical protein [Deltaproteobacteria bacterium]